MLALIAQTAQFLACHALRRVVDRTSALPRGSTPSEAERLMRENLALKAQVRALVLELKRQRGRRPQVSARTRAAQVFAYFLTRGDEAFQRYYLSASVRTLKRWATTFRRPPWRRRQKRRLGRPPLANEFRSLIVTLKVSPRPGRGDMRVVGLFCSVRGVRAGVGRALGTGPAFACPTCRPFVHSGVKSQGMMCWGDAWPRRLHKRVADAPPDTAARAPAALSARPPPSTPHLRHPAHPQASHGRGLGCVAT